MERGARTLTFRVTQIISVRGGFREYLHQMGAGETSNCQEFGASVETAQHTLEECLRFGQHRQELKRIIWRGLPPAAITAAFLGTEELRISRRFFGTKRSIDFFQKYRNTVSQIVLLVQLVLLQVALY